MPAIEPFSNLNSLTPETPADNPSHAGEHNEIKRQLDALVDIVMFHGLLNQRPDPADVPLNFLFFADDLNIAYCNLADGWHQAGYDEILYSAIAMGHAYVENMTVGATETYPGESH